MERWESAGCVPERNVSLNLALDSKRLVDVPTPLKLVQEGRETSRWNRRENVSQDPAFDPGRPNGGASASPVHAGQRRSAAQSMSEDLADVAPGREAEIPRRATWWACPGRSDVSAGWRTLALSAVDVLRRPVPVAGPGAVFALCGSVKKICLGTDSCCPEICSPSPSGSGDVHDKQVFTTRRYSTLW